MRTSRRWLRPAVVLALLCTLVVLPAVFGAQPPLDDAARSHDLVVPVLAMEEPTIAVASGVNRFVHDGNDRIYAIDSVASQLHAVDINSRAVVMSIPVAAQPSSARLVNGGSHIYVLSAMSRSVSVVESATFSLVDTIDLAPWVESVPAEPDALMVNDAAGRVLVNARSPLLLANGDRFSFYGSILTIDAGTRSVTGVAPVWGSPTGSYEMTTYGGNLVNGFEGVFIYYKGSEAGILYSKEIGSGQQVSSKLFTRPECASIDVARMSILVYAGEFVVNVPVVYGNAGAYLGSGQRKVLDLRRGDENASRSEFCRLAIDDERNVAYLLDSRRSRLVTIDLAAYQVLDIKRLDPQPSDMAILKRQEQLAVVFPEAGEIRLYPRFRR